MKTLTVLCTLFLVLLADVGSAARIRDVEEPLADTRIVYGSFDFYEAGELNRKSRATLFILPADEEKTLDYRVPKSDDGVFYWGLEPGEYLLIGYSVPRGGVMTRYIGAEFEVPESDSDIYIGTIEVRMGSVGPGLAIEDHFERVARIYADRFPERAGTSADRTLREPRVGDFASVHNPCAPEWGIQCEDKRMGVTPLTPSVKKLPGLWPRTDSLAPTFSWEPSQSEGVSYDLVIYDAVVTSQVYMKGRLVRYEEGLTDSQWQPSVPLEPATRYYWSVRLRRGDKVTGWSTQGFFMFALVAWGSGSGQWFQFRTP